MTEEQKNKHPGVPLATVLSLLWGALWGKKSECLLIPFTVTHSLILSNPQPSPFSKGKPWLQSFRKWIIAPLMRRCQQRVIVLSLLEKTRLMQWYWIPEQQINISPLIPSFVKAQPLIATDGLPQLVFASHAPDKDGLPLLLKAWSRLTPRVELTLFLPKDRLKHYQKTLFTTLPWGVSWHPLDLWENYQLASPSFFVWPSFDDLHSPFPLKALNKGAFLLLSPYSTLCEVIPIHLGRTLDLELSVEALAHAIKREINLKQTYARKNIFVKKTL